MTVSCLRHCEVHFTRTVPVTLGGPTAYSDLTPIPPRLGRSFGIEVWDPDRQRVDGLAYCPARCVVSETITHLGVWSPDETTLALTVLDGHPGTRMFDFGAHVGWFTLLAASCGAAVTAFEADEDNLDLLRLSVQRNGWAEAVDVRHLFVDATTPVLAADGPVRFVKIDVEGAESDAVRMLAPLLDAGMVDHLLVEVSPVFCAGYPELVVGLVDRGFRAYLLPPKQRPPVDLADPATALEPYRLDLMSRADLAALVASWDQSDVWFVREGAEW